MADSATVPVVSGLASGIALVLLFSLLSPPIQTDLEPKVSHQQAIGIAESEIEKNVWFFRVLPDTTFYVIDFKDAISYPETRFLEEDRVLPLVFIHPTGRLTDVIGNVADDLDRCKEEPGFGWCEFLTALRATPGTRGDLSYFVVLEWDDHTEIFAVDAIHGKVLDSTIYERPILHLEEVERDLKEIGPPVVSQDQAFRIVEQDLRERNPQEFEKILLIEYNRERYVPAEEFHRNNMQLPLIYIHPAGTLVFVNGTDIAPGYYCDSGLYPYCGFAPPFNLNSKGRLIYGVDIVWNSGAPDIFAVDAVTGEIVDSTSLRKAARAD